jgi:hypothetical protein
VFAEPGKCLPKAAVWLDGHSRERSSSADRIWSYFGKRDERSRRIGIIVQVPWFGKLVKPKPWFESTGKGQSVVRGGD